MEDDVGEAIVMSLLEKQNDEKGLTTKIKKKLKEHRERVSRLSEISSFVLILLYTLHILSCNYVLFLVVRKQTLGSAYIWIGTRERRTVMMSAKQAKWKRNVDLATQTRNARPS